MKTWYRTWALNALAVLTLGGAGVVVAASDGVTGVADQPAQAAEEADSPSARARATGEPVEVPELTTPVQQVMANPDGTFRMTQHVTPVRALQDGAWVPIDTTLTVDDTGAVVPRAAAVSLTFSGGGDDALVSLSLGDKQLTLRWPGGPLPRPQLDGDTATYREVLPGVDLRMRARPQGYAQVFVVHDREAALNPQLRELTLELETVGVSVEQREDSSLVAVTSDGEEVFQAPPARMWEAGADLATAGVDLATAGADLATAGPGPATVDAPQRREASVGVELTDTSLTLLPDQDLLTDPDTRFPVEIDPDWGAGRNAWALVYGLPTQYRTQSYWFGDGDNEAKVGYSNWQSPTVRVRSYFQFDVRALHGKEIISAEFNAYQNWASTCTPTKVYLHETGAISPSTTWDKQPWIGQALDNRVVAAGRSGCPGKWVGFNARGAVVNSVKNRTSTVTVMLKAADESDRMAWKKFNPNNVELEVTYNSYPRVPTGMRIEQEPCALVPNEPQLYTTQPRLRVTASDPDGGTVAVRFEWHLRGSGVVGETRTSFQPSGTEFSITIPAGAYQDGDTLAWRASTYDNRVWSDWGDWCEATIDQTAPDQPPTVSSLDYPERQLGGAIGATGEFTFTANGVEDVVGYYYDLHDQPQRYVEADQPGGSATGFVTPPQDGPASLYVRSVDGAGNLSPIYRYDFLVGRGTPPVGHWRLDGFYLDTEVPDESGNGHHGTAHGIAERTSWWDTGRHGDSLRFTGAGGYVSTNDGPVVRTDRTFSVAAWVRLAAFDSGWRTMVSQDGDQISGFFLQLDPNTHQWRFMMPASDTNGAHRRIAASDRPAVLDRWTHLVGTYDQATGELTLYVDGVAQQQTASHPTAWRADGPLQIGRARYNSGPVDYFNGQIDEVRVYDRMLSAVEIRELATAPAVLEGFWTLDGGSGDIVVDHSGNRRDGSRGDGVSRIDTAKVGDGALRFDGGVVTTGATGVRTDASYTVSAYVRLDTADDTWQIPVSQDGAVSSGFALMYRGDNQKWTFTVSPGDGANPNYQWVDSSQSAVAGAWTELTGVYDAAAQELRIYVNGSLSGVQPLSTDLEFEPVSGGLVLGRGKRDSAPLAPFVGEVDHVRVYSGVRTADQIRWDFLIPPQPEVSPYDGQFSRWVGHVSSEHIMTTTTSRVPNGYHFEGSLGMPAPADAPNTRMLYSCIVDGDQFVSVQADCEGHRLLDELGHVYVTRPPDVPAMPLYECVSSYGERYTSPWVDCGDDTLMLLGYSRAYAHLIRYEQVGTGDRYTSSVKVPGSYQMENRLGVVLLGDRPGTVPLTACRDGADTFSSLDPDCEGAEVIQWMGGIWEEPPPGSDHVALFQCRVDSTGERFDSTDPGCDGHTQQQLLGYLLLTVP